MKIHILEAIPQVAGETVGQFMQRIEQAARKHCKEAFGEERRCCVTDVASSTVYVNVWNYEESIDTFISMDFARTDGGGFDFGQWQEVRRVVSYTPALEPERQLEAVATDWRKRFASGSTN